MLMDVILLVIGSAIALYTTVVFERRQRFGEIVREIARERQHFEGYPIGPNDLTRAHQKAVNFWRLIESRRWALDADAHHEAAKRVSRLESFIYRATAQMERMIADVDAHKSIDALLSAFQSEYGRIRDQEFIRFEETLRPSWSALFAPFPHPMLPARREIATGEYFTALG